MGVYNMSADFDELVETSNNIAKVVLAEESYGTMLDTFFCRKLFDLANSLRSAFELMDAKWSFGISYPGWTLMLNQNIRCSSSYLRKTNWKKPRVVA
jgi:dipeptidase D